MALFRQQYTRPVPAGALVVPVACKRPLRIREADRAAHLPHVEQSPDRTTASIWPHVRLQENERTVHYPLTEDGTRYRRRSAKWYGQYTDGAGVTRRVPLTENKDAAKQLLAELVRTAALERAGVRSPEVQAAGRAVADHLADWQATLEAGGKGGKHARQRFRSVRDACDGCGFLYLSDIAADRLVEYLNRMRAASVPALPAGQESFRKAELAALLGVKPSAIGPLVKRHRLPATGNGKARRFPRATAEALLAGRGRGAGNRTVNYHLGAFKQFCRWLLTQKRMTHNPVAHLRQWNAAEDRRRSRRPLTADELRAVVAAAAASPAVLRGLPGPDRAMLYAVAVSTGFRAGEVGSLAPASFLLDAEVPVVVLAAEAAKNGKAARIPLPPALAASLRQYLVARPGNQPVWPGAWVTDAAEVLQHDLEAAGIPYTVASPDGPLYADFHSLRHTFISLLDQSGVTLKEAMQLARHSDPKLTLAVYGRAQIRELATAIGKLPTIHPGTSAYTALTQIPGNGGEEGRVSETSDPRPGSGGALSEPLDMTGFENAREGGRVKEKSAPRRTRTYNPLIKSPAKGLCHTTRHYENPCKASQFWILTSGRIGPKSPRRGRFLVGRTLHGFNPARGRGCTRLPLPADVRRHFRHYRWCLFQKMRAHRHGRKQVIRADPLK